MQWYAAIAQVSTHTQHQVRCPQCHKPTPFDKLVEDVTRSGPLGTKEEGGRVAGQNYADTCNQVVAAAAGGAGGGPSDPNAAARHDDEQAEKRKKEAAAEDVEVELSQQMGALASPSKPPAPKKPKKGGFFTELSQ